MKITNRYTFDAPREAIWPLIYDPAALVKLIPGCEQLEQVSPTEYRGEMQFKIPAVSGVFTTYVKLLEREEPRYCCFEGEVIGAAGTATGRASFELAAREQQTEMQYEGQALLTGSLARLDSRFVESIVQTLIKQGLGRLNKRVQNNREG